jgi:pantoate--beta-alanine ligase
MRTARNTADLRQSLVAWRSAGETVALVPTMGALHAGHLSLVRIARARCDRVVASLFVNPAQFSPGEDLAAYPRDEAGDSRLFAEAAVDVLFAPGADDIYPPGFATTVSVSGLTDCLCGPLRPGHFDGVATVVSKLLVLVQPDVAVFGEKDYQQLLVIRRLAADLGLAAEIVGAPTVREEDGLALSSRNAYLDARERAAAPALHRTIAGIAGALVGGEAEAAPLCAQGRADLLAAGFSDVDYLELRHAETLAPLARADAPSRVFAAARLGRARLIDNVPVAAV